MAVGDHCWVPRDPNWTPFGYQFDKMMAEMEGRTLPEYNALDIYEKPPKPKAQQAEVWETNKIAVIVPVSEAVLYDQIDYWDLIKRAPAAHCQREAMETYWQDVPEWDNPTVERGYN